MIPHTTKTYLFDSVSILELPDQTTDILSSFLSFCSDLPHDVPDSTILGSAVTLLREFVEFNLADTGKESPGCSVARRFERLNELCISLFETEFMESRDAAPQDEDTEPFSADGLDLLLLFMLSRQELPNAVYAGAFWAPSSCRTRSLCISGCRNGLVLPPSEVLLLGPVCDLELTEADVTHRFSELLDLQRSERFSLDSEDEPPVPMDDEFDDPESRLFDDDEPWGLPFLMTGSEDFEDDASEEDDELEGELENTPPAWACASVC